MEFLEGIEITLGPAVIVVAPIVAAIIQLLKHVQFNGRPVLPDERAVWAANALLGGVAFTLYQVSIGESIGTAIISAIAAILGASGVYEGAKAALGKAPSQASPDPQSEPD